MPNQKVLISVFFATGLLIGALAQKNIPRQNSLHTEISPTGYQARLTLTKGALASLYYSHEDTFRIYPEICQLLFAGGYLAGLVNATHLTSEVQSPDRIHNILAALKTDSEQTLSMFENELTKPNGSPKSQKGDN